MNRTEAKELNVSLVSMVLQLQERVNIAARVRSARLDDLRREYDKKLQTDPLLIQYSTEMREWDTVFANTAAEVFPAGTLIRWRTDIYVVCSVGGGVIQGKQVVYPAPRKKHLASVRLSSEIEIITVDDLADSKLQREAKKLIAAVRMKDW